jgi:hypothetical protein
VRDDKVTVKSRPSGITFRENYSNYKSSKSYVPRKVKAQRRLLAQQNSMSDLNFHDLVISKKLESENDLDKPKISVRSQPHSSPFENVT